MHVPNAPRRPPIEYERDTDGWEGWKETVRSDARRNALLNRYAFASAVLPDHGDLLDVPCGNGLGTLRLAAVDGRKVTGVDVPGLWSDLEIPPAAAASFDAGDVTTLPFEEQSFDGVVSLEGFRTAQEARLGIAELSRVLRANGSVISSITGPKDTELSTVVLQLLKTHFGRVRVLAEVQCSGTVIVGDLGLELRYLELEDRQPAVAVEEQADRLLVVAGRAAHDDLRSTARLSTAPSNEDLRRLSAERDALIHAHLTHITRLERERDMARELSDKLLEAEQLISTIPQLQQAIKAFKDRADASDAHARESQQRVLDFQRSTSWRITAPIRRIKDLLTGRTDESAAS